jgi:3-oxoacyl-(acyl-carrier-protein) synthase
MGALTPVGLDVASTWDAIVHGRSGIAPVQRFETDDLDVRIAGEVKDFAKRRGASIASCSSAWLPPRRPCATPA